MKRSRNRKTLILGAGMTGLAAGYASGLPVFEAQRNPGGICSSYYIAPHTKKRLSKAPKNEEVYRFEIGGGHWIFGGDSFTKNLINSLTPTKRYERKAGVFFPDRNLHVPYPLQNHLSYFKEKERAQAMSEIIKNSRKKHAPETMQDFLSHHFGKTLSELFFHPFHERYTAGLYTKIAPQDSYKTPVNLTEIIEGANGKNKAVVGYNTHFIYPEGGLDALARKLATKCDITFGKKVARIDRKKKQVQFEDGTRTNYDSLLSTLPLNTTLKLSGIALEESPHPSPSVLVLNIGARKGKNTPEEQWIFIPHSKSGFHRVGFYSNVDNSFVPKSARGKENKVSIYVERAFAENTHLSAHEVEEFMKSTIAELQEWGWITDVEVADPTWIEVAYTWSWPNSTWREKGIASLEAENIYPVGRYARWVFQGIADSIRDGLIAGSSFKK